MKARRTIAGIGLLAALAAGPGAALAQTRIGQYEDEAPLRTWNAAPFTLAAALGMTEGAVKVAVSRLRQRYRKHLEEEIAKTVAVPEEVDGELRHLLRVLARR